MVSSQGLLLAAFLETATLIYGLPESPISERPADAATSPTVVCLV